MKPIAVKNYLPKITYVSVQEIKIIVIYRYSNQLAQTVKFGIRTGVVSGMGLGFFFAAIYGSSALSLWWDSKLVREDDDYTAGKMVSVGHSR